MKPFFSIILPTFNQAKFLKECIQSVLNQSFENWELLIINNNSTDNTQKIIKAFRDKRINVFKINNKGLLAKSRNLGIKKAKADWICFVDSDDKWFPDKLLLVKKYINIRNGDFYHHDLIFQNKRFLFRKKIFDKSSSIKRPILRYFARNGNPIGQSSVVVKKKILTKVNYISENKEKFSWEDFDTWIKISKITDKFIRIPNILGSIWVGPENISNLERQIINTARIKKYYYKMFNKLLPKKDKNKNLWWLEYPLILKDFKKKNRKNLVKRINNVSTAPIKFNLIFLYMRGKLSLFNILKETKKIFTIIILFRSKKKFKNLNLKNRQYKKITNIKNLKEIKFNNFDIPNQFFERIKNNNELHIIYDQKRIISYGWSTKNKNFLISEINCKIGNKNNVIFFDFYTIENFRKKGFYKILLNKMMINYRLNNCFIYTTLFNIRSLKTINKSNFEFKGFYTFFKKKIDLL